MSAATPFAPWLAEMRAAGVAWPDNLVWRRTVDSTNRLGRRVVDVLSAEDETPRPALIVAWHQTAGRGRLGRRWESRAGLGLYATLIWPVESDQQLPTLPLLVAVALCEGLSSLLARPCRLDWPNDLVVDGAKLGGILIESVTREEGTVALIGFGINLAHDAQELPARATSLRLLGAGRTAGGQVLPTLAGVLGERLAQSAPSGDLLASYRAASVHRVGEDLSCRVGAETIAGTFAGFDDSGFLRLETPAGLRTISAGEIVE